MKKASLIIIFVVLFIAFSLIKLPVNLIVEQVSVPKNVSYKGLTGTIWQGQIDALQIQGWTLSQVKWEFQLSEILNANAGFQISFGNARNSQQLSGKGKVAFGSSGLSLANTTVRVPAHKIAPMLPIPVSGVEGRVIVDIDSYRLDIEQQAKTKHLCNELTGELLWNQAAVNFGTPVDFGTFSSTLDCQENKLLAKFDGNNKLGLEGLATIVSNSKYNFNGFVKPDMSLPVGIRNGASMFGRKMPNGKYSIKL